MSASPRPRSARHRLRNPRHRFVDHRPCAISIKETSFPHKRAPDVTPLLFDDICPVVVPAIYAKGRTPIFKHPNQRKTSPPPMVVVQAKVDPMSDRVSQECSLGIKLDLIRMRRIANVASALQNRQQILRAGDKKHVCPETRTDKAGSLDGCGRRNGRTPQLARHAQAARTIGGRLQNIHAALVALRLEFGHAGNPVAVGRDEQRSPTYRETWESERAAIALGQTARRTHANFGVTRPRGRRLFGNTASENRIPNASPRRQLHAMPIRISHNDSATPRRILRRRDRRPARRHQLGIRRIDVRHAEPNPRRTRRRRIVRHRIKLKHLSARLARQREADCVVDCCCANDSEIRLQEWKAARVAGDVTLNEFRINVFNLLAIRGGISCETSWETLYLAVLPQNDFANEVKPLTRNKGIQKI
jgi:hypothetical protein